MPKFKFTLGIRFHNAEHKEIVEITESELEGLDENAIENYVEDYYRDWCGNYLDGGWERVGDEEEEG